MPNYWYSSQPYEIFLDLDSKRAYRRALSVLRVAIHTKKLLVSRIYAYPTQNDNHCHVIVISNAKMEISERVAWSLWMANDRLRSAYVLVRDAYGVFHSDLLVSVVPYYREPDATCECEGKHKDHKITDACPAMNLLLGVHRNADYFARTGPTPKVKNDNVRIPWGRISKRTLLKMEA